uniref:Alpha-1,3-glucosyltransferase n=1 Tax=Panagrellus redivivus TaxID=6233 RepID=A0A7E4VGV6_PANRE
MATSPSVRRRKPPQPASVADSSEDSTSECPNVDATTPSVFTFRSFYIVSGLLLCLKLLLFRCYASTDFEVHRNWMAITHHEPLGQWYFNNVSRWTLDYPPFFAYFEKALSIVAAKIDEDMLIVSEEPIMDGDVLLFQRLSVIAVDLVFIIASGLLADAITQASGDLWPSVSAKMRLKLAVFVVLATQPSLILLDNIHFQYNSMMYGIFMLVVASVAFGKPVLAALLFAILLNFKHIYLYYVPAFIAFYLFEYLPPFRDVGFLWRGFHLALAVVSPVVLSFGPFYAQGQIPAILQIFSRLFPFKRGLTHSYWAPNFWALYNTVDYALYKVISSLKLQKQCFQFSFLKCDVRTPAYISGIVEDYQHSVLPNVRPGATFALIIAFLLPVALFFFKSNRNHQLQKLLIAVTLSAYPFFLFGWHVHEKALVMVALPLMALGFLNIRYLQVSLLIAMLTPATQFPLIFMPVEDLVKYGLTLGSWAVTVALVRFVYRLELSQIVSRTNVLFGFAVVALEVYKVAFHRLLFGTSAEFLPLLLTSLILAIGVFVSYLQFLWVTFGEQVSVEIAKWRCHLRERSIKAAIAQELHPKIDISQVKHIAGVDLSALATNPELAVASLTVLTFPELKVVYTADRVVHVTQPYVPEYLAIRESDLLSDLVNDSKSKAPQIDVIFVDGNGRYHSRLSGLACHISLLTSIPTIGVAKNFTAGPLLKNGFSKDAVVQFEADLQKRLSASKSGIVTVAPFEKLDPLLAVVRGSSKSHILYVSAGLGIDTGTSAELALGALIHSVVEPIRLSDLRSRALLNALFIDAKHPCNY